MPKPNKMHSQERGHAMFRLSNFTPVQWAWIILGPVISIGSKVYEVWQMTPTLLGLPLWTYEVAGLLIFFCAIIGLLIGHKRDIDERLSKKAEPTNQSVAGSAQLDIEFFSTIDDLRAKHPLSETFKPENDIHAFFLSGEGVLGEHSEYVKCVKRLILPQPDDNNLARLRGISKTIDFKSQIYTCRNMARQNNVKSVRFYKDFTGISLLFCNPDRLEAWVQVGMILPESESRERHHYRLYKSKNEKAFLSLYETFNRLWIDSNENTAEEDMQEGFDGKATVNRPILQVPITMEFNPENGRYSNQEDRPSDASVVIERYREYYCTMFNDSDESLTNVSCEIERIITIPNRPNDTQIAPENIHDKCRYDLPACPTKSDFPPRGREKLWLFSRLTKALDNEPIRIVNGSKCFHDKGRQRQVFLRVTADNHAQKNFSVICWVQDGILRMGWIRPED